MVRHVDIGHWLDSYGDLPTDDPKRHSEALRLAQLVEAGALLEPGELREALVACTKRVDGKRCLGLMWVEKRADDQLHAYCRTCARDELFITGWQDTRWANGPMLPLSDPMFAILQNVN